MEFRYMGFDQQDSTRAYRFDGVEKGQPVVRLVVIADLTLCLKHHVSIQEGPALYARKLTADSAVPRLQDRQLTNQDLLEFAAGRADAKARKAGTHRPPRPIRGVPLS
jgi:hypothetical protein